MLDSNAVGVCFGVIARNNGVGHADPSNAQTSFCRGILRTTEDGLIHWDTVFPGGYPHRAPHFHVLVHKNATATSLPSPVGTAERRKSVAHVGQLLFRQELVDEVMKMEPYREWKADMVEKGGWTENVDDAILWCVDRTSDLMMSYRGIVERSVSAGIVLWVHVGVNMSHIVEKSSEGTRWAT